MSLTKEISDVLKSIASTSSLANLSVVATDGNGAMKRISSAVFVRHQSAYLADADYPGLTSDGIIFFRTNNTTLNLPSDAASKWGIIMVLAISSNQIIEKYIPYAASAYQEFARRGNTDGSWNAWNQVH